MSNRKRMSWTKFALELANHEEGKKMDVKALKIACKGIMPQLDKHTIKKKYRILTPKQQDIILKHLGYL